MSDAEKLAKYQELTQRLFEAWREMDYDVPSLDNAIEELCDIDPKLPPVRAWMRNPDRPNGFASNNYIALVP